MATVTDIEDVVFALRHGHRPVYHQITSEDAVLIRQKLLNWYDEHKRALPWRKSYPKDFETLSQEQKNEWLAQRAYEVWVSEIMLQQTQVATVLDYYAKWMKNWPTVYDLATADPEAVVQAWSGLGYYSRARRLQEAAKIVVQKYDGLLPMDAATLNKNIPGVGPYTAGAISSIVFNQPAELVDGNVVRLVSRLRSIGADSKSPTAVALHWSLAKQLLDVNRPGDFNQAMMDLGATVCTPKNPLCQSCPLKDHCYAFKEDQAADRILKDALAASLNSQPSEPTQGVLTPSELCNLCPPPPNLQEIRSRGPFVTQYPRKALKKDVRVENIAVCVVCCGDKGPNQEFLIVRRPSSGLLAGMWEFPSCIIETDDVPPYNERCSQMDVFLYQSLGLQKDTKKAKRKDVGTVTHVFTHLKHVYHVEVLELNTRPISAQLDSALASKYTTKWVHQGDMKSEAMSTGMLKVLDLVAATTPSAVKRNAKEIDNTTDASDSSSKKKSKTKAATAETSPSPRSRSKKATKVDTNHSILSYLERPKT